MIKKIHQSKLVKPFKRVGRQAGKISVVALLSLQLSAQPKDAVSYIKLYAPLAKQLSAKTGIPASVILGVSLIESGHGAGKNCILLNNHFGIVGRNNLAKRQTNYRSVYKEYANSEASFYDFCRIVKLKKYYAILKGSKDYKRWLQSMNAHGYSSAKQIWVKRITHAIEVHRLYLLDAPSVASK